MKRTNAIGTKSGTRYLIIAVLMTMRTAKYVNIKIRIRSIFKYAALLCFLNQYSEAKINPIKKLIAANIGLIVSCHGRNHEIISSKKFWLTDTMKKIFGIKINMA